MRKLWVASTLVQFGERGRTKSDTAAKLRFRNQFGTHFGLDLLQRVGQFSWCPGPRRELEQHSQQSASVTQR